MENKPILECVVITTTSQEISTGKLNLLIDVLCEEPRNSLDLIIFVNNNFYDKLKINRIFSSNFNKVTIVNLNIHPSDDIYVRQITKKVEYVPKYGLINGPNTMFFEIIKYCKHYDTIILLEYDCIVEKYFTLKCKDYVNSNPPFLISGSKYLGGVSLDKKINDHLNGVAFYRTGSQELQDIIEDFRIFLIYKVKHTLLNYIAYDVGLCDFIKKNYQYLIDNELYRTTDLIVNYSLESDKFTPINSIRIKHPNCAIIHKKL
jgi:hypothetical protein